MQNSISFCHIFNILLDFIESVKSQGDATVSAINIVANSADELSNVVIGDILRALVAGGKVSITLPVGNNSVKRNLMFSGFTSVSVSTEDNTQKLTACKPEFEVGASAAVKLNPVTTSQSTWSFDLDDDVCITNIFFIHYYTIVLFSSLLS